MTKMLHFSDAYHRPYFMGISIIIIFLMHIWSFTKAADGVDLNIISNFFMHGDFGVDVFFFLSTYGLSYSINKNSLRSFFFNRFERIVPVYIVFLILCIALFITTDLSKGALYFLASLSGYACIKDCVYQVEWYTPSLILIYVLFPAINFISKRIANLHILVISLLLIILHTLLYYINIGVCNMLAYRIPIIILGCVIYYVERKHNNTDVQLISLLGLFGIFMFAGNIYRVTLAIPAVLYLVGKADKLPLHKYISTLGKWSFEVYLAQVIATKYFIPYYEGSIKTQLLYLFVITIFFSLVFSNITKYSKILIEKIRHD